LALGGAYSVDKWYRLERGWMWFANEQIAKEDMEMIEAETAGNFYDVVLSHTCPYSWQPTDLFIDAVDQSTVDNTTEKWLEKMADNIIWGKWCFGHFHQTRDIYEESVRMLADDYLMDLEEWYNI
jgi:3-oxoacid CoA-transferase subunit A